MSYDQIFEDFNPIENEGGCADKAEGLVERIINLMPTAPNDVGLKSN